LTVNSLRAFGLRLKLAAPKRQHLPALNAEADSRNVKPAPKCIAISIRIEDFAPRGISMRKPRILIVDDESSFIRLLKLALEKKRRYTVRDENDSTRAVATARKFKPDLVLLDFVMPKEHGADVAAKIRAEPRLCETPILFLSGTVAKQRGEASQIAGFEALAKPIGLDDLLAAIDRNLAAAAAGRKPGRLPRWLAKIGGAFARRTAAPRTAAGG
jgi:CheY-like chemotaxis protein